VELPEDVRRLALDPFGELPTPREVELVDLDGAVVSINPALTVQAGRMSRPICERMGFAFVGAVRVFVDELPD
jgi:hypothetical protein